MIYLASISVFSGVIIGLVGVLSLLEKKVIGGGNVIKWAFNKSIP